jgi:carbamate kinase
LHEHGIKRNVLTLMTMVEVDPNDVAFNDPNKRIGKTVNKEEADKLSLEKNWVFKEEKKQKGGYRRVVPSPEPKHIINWEEIDHNARAGTIIIAVGGGGVPVYTDRKGDIRTVDAVVDKDSASSLLATQICADEFYILTDVPFVYANYGEPNQKVLEFLNYADTLKYLENGTFGAGTMAPKIKAALRFIKAGGAKSIITESTKLKDKAYGTKITMEYDERDLHKYDKKGLKKG